MKRLLSLTAKPLATLAIIASVFVAAPVQAELGQTPTTYDASGTSGSSPTSQGWGTQTGAGVTTNSNGSYTLNTNAGTDLQCSASDGMGLALCVSGFVYYITVGIGSWVAGITAYVFDYAVQLSLVSGAYAFDFINIGWGIVRDVANMSFLFILVYIAFKIMFQAETAGTMRMLVWVVVIALLVNFSFLMTRLVIDAGNIVALQFYNAVAVGVDTIQNPGSQSGNATPANPTGTKDITANIMNALNPQGIIGTNGFKNVVSGQGNSAMYYLIVSSIVYILTGVSLFMLAAVFIFAAMRFVMRVIGLWFVIIAAPAAFVAAIFRGKEGGAKWFNKWLGYLLEFSFYPAVFLFMFYIEVRFLQEMNNTALFNNLYNATAQSQNFSVIAQAAASVSIRLGFIVATMYLILRSSQWTGQAFNNTAMKWADRGFVNLARGTLKLGGAGAARVGGLAYQQMVGRTAANANAALERRGIGSSILGYRTRQALQGISRTGVGGARSFDQFKDAREKELADRAKIRERGERRDAIQGLYANNQDEKAAAMAQERADIDQQVKERAQGQAAASSLFRAARREAAQAASPEDITNVAASSIPTGTRRLPGGAAITSVAGGQTGVPSSTPFNIAAQRALDEIKQKAQQTAQAGAVSLNLVATPPNMTKAKEPQVDEARVSAPVVQVGALREEIKGLGQSVRDAVAAAKNGTSMPTKVVVSGPEHAGPAVATHTTSGNAHIGEDEVGKIAKKLAHKLEPILSHTPEPTPPSPSAPAATQPTQPPPSDLGDILPKAA